MPKHALLIGINAYPRLGDLRYAARDAEAVGEVLTQHYGFAPSNVTLMTCKTPGIFLPTQNNIEDQLARLREIDDLELLVVGFWGHGISVPGGEECRRYLCAVDTSDQRLEKTGILRSTLLGHVQQACAENTCLILDCCQNHAVGRSATQLSEENRNFLANGARDIVAAPMPEGTRPVSRKAAVLNSCSFGERAFEWQERKHGIFTAHLLDAMRQSDSVAKWIEYIQPRVYETARKMGQSQKPFASFEGGDIRFATVEATKPKLEIDTECLLAEAQAEAARIIAEAKKQADAIIKSGTTPVSIVHYALFDHDSEGGWAWFDESATTCEMLRQFYVEYAFQHRHPSPNDLTADDLWGGLVKFDDWIVVYRYFNGGNQKIGRPQRFVILTAWIKNTDAIGGSVDLLQVLNSDAFQFVAEHAKKNPVPQLGVTEAAVVGSRIFDLQELSKLCRFVSSDSDYEGLHARIEYIDGQWKKATTTGKPKPQPKKLSDTDNATIKGLLSSTMQPSSVAHKLSTPLPTQSPPIIAPKTKMAGERTVLSINGIEYAFRWCPPGAFMMGSPPNITEKARYAEETQHQVTLTRGFWMLETPVTQAMWEGVMRNNPSHFKGGEKLPVECVSWEDCQEYIQELNRLGIAPDGYCFSLPTEAQWEYACRAGTATDYYFGSTLNKKQANIQGKQTSEVGSYPANAWGLHDMHGNVKEWCVDCLAKYPSKNVTDPVRAYPGAHWGMNEQRVCRGGDWNSLVDECRSANRNGIYPSDRGNRIGIRLALVRIE